MATVAEGTILAPEQDFDVLAARNADPEPNPRGGPDLQKHWLDLQTADGQTFDGCYLRVQVGNGIKAGDRVPGQVVQGKYGPMFKKSGRAIPTGTTVPSQTPSQPVSQASGLYSGPGQSEVRFAQPDPEAERIARSVAIKGAVDLRTAGAINDGQLMATAQALTDYILTGERKAA